MSSRTPTIPEENRSNKGAGEPRTVPLAKSDRPDAVNDSPDKKGQQGNTNINTHHQGYQQDR